jgi:hypothetical protein
MFSLCTNGLILNLITVDNVGGLHILVGRYGEKAEKSEEGNGEDAAQAVGWLTSGVGTQEWASPPTTECHSITTALG